MSRWLTSSLIVLGVLVSLVVAIVLAVWWKQSPQGSATSTTWTCSMHPQVRLPRPGPCPICGMNLIPVEQLTREQSQNRRQAGLQTEPVEARPLVKEILTVGKLDYNESRVEHITTRVAGRVERLYVDFTGVDVKKGEHLVEIYSPNLLVTQRELLLAVEAAERQAARAADDRSSQSMLRSTREKLLLLGVLPEQIEQIEKARQVQTHLTMFAPLTGTVVEKQVRVGQYVEEGDLLYRIAEFDPIWLYLDIYERDVGWIEYGQQVDVTLEAFPGETFQGRVTFVDPFLNDKTRAVKARVNLKNPDRRLKPAMYASAVVRVPLRSDGSPEPTGFVGKFSCPMHPDVLREDAGTCPVCEMKLEQIKGRQSVVTSRNAHEGKTPAAPESGPVLAVPATAVLDTGRRQVVYRAREDGAFELVEVVIGPRAIDDSDSRRRVFFPVLRGLSRGDQVVASGGFMLDSQRQIEGMPSLLYPQGQSAANLHSGHGGMSMPSAAQPSHQH